MSALRRVLGPVFIWVPMFIWATFSGPAQAIPYLPPYARIINQPAVIPTDGVLAIGMVDINQGWSTTTEGELERVEDPSQMVVAGEASALDVPLDSQDAGATQRISLWRPQVPFAVGFYTAWGVSDSGSAQASSFEVVEDAGAGSLDVNLVSQSLTVSKVAASAVGCGTTFGLSGSTVYLTLTTQYRIQPALSVEFSVLGSDARLSQYFGRAIQPGTMGNYAPLPVFEGRWAFSSVYPKAQSEYCMQASLLSLQTGSVVELDPACVADDGTDWSALIPATTEEFDAQLGVCTDPPAEYLPRYCALLRETGAVHAGCEVYSEAALDAALAAPPPGLTQDGGTPPGSAPIPSATAPAITATAAPQMSSVPPDSSEPSQPPPSAAPQASSVPTTVTDGGSPGGGSALNPISNGEQGSGCSLDPGANSPRFFGWAIAPGFLLALGRLRLRKRR